ncbi:MAG: hypothetical protein ACLFV8_14880 [Alphaproteobacteria bacterium]
MEFARNRALLAACAFVLLTAAPGAVFLMRGFPLSLDEFSTWFQARIFLNGHVLAPIEAEWREYADALQPSFIATIGPDLWGAVYRPLNALLLAAFEGAGAGLVMNAVFAAVCVWLTAVIARQLWPQDRSAPVIAAALLALSPQFLVTAMTPYAMTGHLLFTLVWLHLFLRDRTWAYAAAMTVGVVAMGLHQMHIHLLIAFPFVVWLAWRRRWAAAAFGAVYGAAFLFWSDWWAVARMLEGAGMPAAQGAAKVAGVAGGLLEREYLLDVIVWPLNFARFLSWQTLALVPLLVMAWSLRRHAPAPVRVLFWSVLCLFAVHVVLMPAQGHGWGYRYLHPVLGHLSLLAVFGWRAFREQAAEGTVRRSGRALTILGVLTVAVMLPLRFWQVADMVWPVERSVRFLQSADAGVVLVDADGIHIGQDLVRNDPFLANTPKLMHAGRLSAAQLEVLCGRYRVQVADYSDLARFGMPELPESIGNRDGREEELLARLGQAGCLAQSRHKASAG